MKAKILVTGGLGFIGSHLVEKLNELNYPVSVIDNFSAASSYKLPSSVNFFKQNIASPDLSNLIKKINPEIIVHLAADNRVTAPFTDVLESNIIGTYNLLQVAKTANIKQFIFSSSAAVYGDPEILPIKENHPKKPLSAYGLSKLVDELYLEQYQSFFATSIFRFANVYGPRQNSHSEGGVVAIFIDRLLKKQKPIIYGDGHQTRDFVYVGDIVEAIMLAIKKPNSFTLNIGTHQSTSILDLIDKISFLLGIKTAIINKPFRQTEIKDSLFDYYLAKKTLGWQPKTDLLSGLAKTINSFRGL